MFRYRSGDQIQGRICGKRPATLPTETDLFNAQTPVASLERFD